MGSEYMEELKKVSYDSTPSIIIWKSRAKASKFDGLSRGKRHPSQKYGDSWLEMVYPLSITAIPRFVQENCR